MFYLTLALYDCITFTQAIMLSHHLAESYSYTCMVGGDRSVGVASTKEQLIQHVDRLVIHHTTALTECK